MSELMPAAALPEVSAVIVNRNTRELMRVALQSLHAHLSSVQHEVIVIDNGSSDGSQAMISAEFPEAHLISNGTNVGFGAANNQGMAVARGRWFLLLNSDASLVDDSVAALLARLRQQPSIGVAHCKLLSVDGTTQHSAYRFPSLRLAILDNLGANRLLSARMREDLLGGYWDHSTERDVDAVAAAFMLLRREVYEQTGGFDERIFLYGEDIEWCQRIWEAGWRIRYYPNTRVLHHSHATTDLALGTRHRITLQLQGVKYIIEKRSGPVAARLFLVSVMTGALIRLLIHGIRASLARKPRSTATVRFQYLVVLSTLSVLIHNDITETDVAK